MTVRATAPLYLRPIALSPRLPHTHPMRQGYVYILTSKPNGTLYTGVTSDLARRLFEHKESITPGFTTRYSVKTLVWFEEHALVTDAIVREKTIKRWRREWKIKLIEEINPEWQDLSHYLL